MKITKDLLKQIKPQDKYYAGRYSWHFYNFLKHRLYMDVDIYKTIINDYVRYSIRSGDEIWMTNISHIILDNYLDRYTYCGHLAQLCTDEFFQNYIQYGKCFVIPHNYTTLDDEERWAAIDENTRICTWCGQKQKIIEKMVTIKEWKDE